MTSNEVDARIDAVYAQWDGLPMTQVEIAQACGVKEEVIRAISRRAFCKLGQLLALQIQYREACR